MQSDIKYKEWKLGILAYRKPCLSGSQVTASLKNLTISRRQMMIGSIPVDRLITRNIGMKVDNGHGGYENSSFSLHRRTMGLE